MMLACLSVQCVHRAGGGERSWPAGQRDVSLLDDLFPHSAHVRDESLKLRAIPQ